nr:hypothetical protein [Tanacetum cinerariifolium]
MTCIQNPLALLAFPLMLFSDTSTQALHKAISLRTPWMRYIFVILLKLLRSFVYFLLTGVATSSIGESSRMDGPSNLEMERVDKVEKRHHITAQIRHQDEKTGSEKIKNVGYTMVMPCVNDTFDFVLVAYKMEPNTD